MTMERNTALIGALCQAMLDGAPDPLARAGEAVGLVPLTPDEIEAMRDAARERYWQNTHANPNVGFSRWQAEIDAINALEERR